MSVYYLVFISLWVVVNGGVVRTLYDTTNVLASMILLVKATFVCKSGCFLGKLSESMLDYKLCFDRVLALS